MASEYGPLLDALRGVRWPARRAVGAALPGAHRSRQRGTSGEFTEYRLYRQGDDPRQLDWKLLARSDRAFVRLTDDRALLPTWFVLDGSASMAFPEGAGARSKWSVACAITVGLAAVAHAGGDPVGVIAAASGEPRRLAPRTRRGTVNDIMRVLGECTPGGSAPLAGLITALSPRTRIVVVSDLLGDLDAMVQGSAQLVAAGASIECVHVVAEEELSLPAGAHLVRDPEDAAFERVMDRNAETAYRAAFDAFRRDAARRWQASGAGYREVTTGAPLARAVREIVTLQGA